MVKFLVLSLSFLMSFHVDSIASDPSTENPMCKMDWPRDIDPDKCCDMPEFFVDTLIDQCEVNSGIGSIDKNNEYYEWSTELCVVDCIFVQTGLGSADKIDKVKVINYLLNITKSDQTWNEKIGSTVDKCFNSSNSENHNKFVQEIFEDSKGTIKPNQCDPKAAYLIDCFYFQFFKDCPGLKMLSTDIKCSVLFEYTKTCDRW